jgi:hypothetical protein
MHRIAHNGEVGVEARGCLLGICTVGPHVTGQGWGCAKARKPIAVKWTHPTASKRFKTFL